MEDEKRVEGPGECQHLLELLGVIAAVAHDDKGVIVGGGGAGPGFQLRGGALEQGLGMAYLGQ